VTSEKTAEKKKIKSTLGELEMSKSHPYISGMKHSIAISPLLQSHVLEFSSEQPFERAMKLLGTALPAAKIGASQGQRLTQHYGNLAQAEEILREPGFDFKQVAKKQGQAQRADVLYVQMDGGHLLTDDGFRETKVGRIFAGHHLTKVSSDNEGVNLRMKLEESDYLAHLGPYTEFTARFGPLIRNHLRQAPSSLRVVALSDGVGWIAKWLLAEFPFIILILDFYHVMEHLGGFAKLAFTSESRRSEWIESRKQELLSGQIDQVIEAIRQKRQGRRASIVEKANQLIAYYDNNRYRMKYHEYRAAGYCIGSGAVESAISTVVQQRCKLVGQRWTEKVAAVLNVRSIFKSGKRNKLRTLINQQMGCEKVA
jgi:hypothetical protein